MAGLGAASVASIASDEQVQQSIADEDWPEAVDQASYHLPIVGPGRSGVEALLQGEVAGAVWGFGVLGLEACGLKWARVPRVGAGAVQGEGKAVARVVQVEQQAVVTGTQVVQAAEKVGEAASAAQKGKAAASVVQVEQQAVVT